MYCVTIVFKKTLNKKTKLSMASGLIKANSAQEALGIAISGKSTCDPGDVFMHSVVICNESEGVSFQDVLNNLS